jgi:hypothetical protein
MPTRVYVWIINSIKYGAYITHWWTISNNKQKIAPMINPSQILLNHTGMIDLKSMVLSKIVLCISFKQ